MKPLLPLWTALYLPRLALDVIERQRPPHDAELPAAATRIAIVAQRRVLDCDDGTRTAGVMPGMTMAAAEALLPGLPFIERNPQAEAQAQRDLALWALGVTSTVVLHGDAALILEAAGSMSYFGGIDVLLGKMEAEVTALGFRAQFGTAPTPQGALVMARGMAHSKCRHCALTSPQTRQVIGTLPIEALESAAPHLATLASLAIDTIGALIAMPRAGLKRRFGAAMLDELDRALGERPDPREAFEAPERYDSRLELLGEISNSDTLLFLAKRLLDPLAGFLGARRAGLAEYTLVFLHERGRHGTIPPTRLRIELLSPSDKPGHLLMLLKERLARQALTAPAVELRLEAHHLVPMDEQALALWPDPRGVAGDLERLIERLNARMGPEAVRRLQEVPDHRPERASALVPAAAGATEAKSAGRAKRDTKAAKVTARAATDELPLPRPFWLLSQARPLQERKGGPHYEGPLKLIRGPECIESGWWDGDTARDYFLARTTKGAVVWLYRTRPRNMSECAEWFIHGFFS